MGDRDNQVLMELAQFLGGRSFGELRVEAAKSVAGRSHQFGLTRANFADSQVLLDRFEGAQKTEQSRFIRAELIRVAGVFRCHRGSPLQQGYLNW